ncbi:MAG: mercuric transport protein MerTP [Cellulophaga sp.]
MKIDKKLIGASIITAIAASLCCIVPLLALFSGASSMASLFSWVVPFSPYLIGFTILVLVFAWYQKLKPIKKDNCNCETVEKQRFIQSKVFLGIVTLFAALMLTFPYFSSVFYSNNGKEIAVASSENLKAIDIGINGMTCFSCEGHINYSVNQLDGVISIVTSYNKGNAIVQYDSSKTTMEEIKETVNSTGYSVIEISVK